MKSTELFMQYMQYKKVVGEECRPFINWVEYYFPQFAYLYPLELRN